MGNCKIRRKKRLFEADGDQQATQTQQPANAQTQPANAAPAQPQNQNQNPQQQAQQQEQQEDPKIKERREKVTACINNIKEVISKNDPYALLVLNIPDLMQQTVPNMSQDGDAKETMTKWEDFKKAPSEQSFNAMIDAFATYGNGGQKPGEQNQQNGQQNQNANNQQNAQQSQQPAQQQAQPAQAQQPAANAPAPAQAANAATTAQAEAEHSAKTFGERLNENLSAKLRIVNAAKSVRTYRPIF